MGSMTQRKQNSLFITLVDLVSEDHPYRKLDALLSFDELANPFLDIYSAKGRKEKGVSFGLRCQAWKAKRGLAAFEFSCKPIALDVLYLYENSIYKSKFKTWE
jgi:hypothetical protein